MPIRLTPCQNEECECRFKVRKINKPYVGIYKDKPVFHWHYYCPHGHYQFVRYWNEYCNGYYDQVAMLEIRLIANRWDADKVRDLEKELEIARDSLDRVNSEVKRVIG